MMAGGGFLKQMNDTIRYNLELKKNLRRKPEKNTSSPKTEQLTDHQSLSEKDRIDLLAGLKRSQREEQIKKLIALTVSLIITVTLYLIIRFFS